jgi:acetyltransferase AlgX (SGNH hydrolase-like protein)
MKSDLTSREAQANAEVGHTQVSTPVKWFLVIQFSALVFLTPLALHFAYTDQPASSIVAALAKIPPSSSDLAKALDANGNGAKFNEIKAINSRMLQAIQQTERGLEEHPLLSRWVVAPTTRVIVGHLKAGTEEVYCGVANWLFYRPGIDYLTGPGFLEPTVLARRGEEGNEWQAPPEVDPVAAIIEFGQELGLRDIKLGVLPAPPKALVYPEHFSTRYRDGDRVPQNPSYEEFKSRLGAAGIEVLDAAQWLVEAKPAEESPLYLETDTHWSPRGVSVVADALADHIRNGAMLSARQPDSYTIRSTTVSALGDIAGMLRFPPAWQAYRPEQVEITQVLTADGEYWAPDRDAEILLLGDSFSNVFSSAYMGWGEAAGLPEQLSAALERPVDTIIINDNGAFAARRQLSHELWKGVDRLANKKLVIYEFAMRELAVGDWKTGLDLTLGSPVDSTSPDDLAPPSTEISGTIAHRTYPPDPGSVPYKDCLIALHLEDVQGLGDTTEIVLFTWGFRDNRLTGATAYEIGQVLTAQVEPWSIAEQRVGTYARVELDDINLLWLDAYWYDQGQTVDSRSDEVPVSVLPGRVLPTGGTKAASTRSFFGETTTIVEELERTESWVHRGPNDWLFLVSDLMFLNSGPFWGADALNTSLAPLTTVVDPLPPILDFNTQLRDFGIRLIVVPVPSKASIYPEEVVSTYSAASLRRGLDDIYEEFLSILTDNGVEVLNLAPIFRRARGDDRPDLFCHHDTHWSPRACEIAARHIAERLRGESWLADVPKTRYVTEPHFVDITGNMWRWLEGATPERETLLATALWEEGAVGERGPTSWRESPVVLLGDSNCLVFHEEKIYDTHSGLFDHLAKELGFPAELIATSLLAANTSRTTLARRSDSLPDKRAVIWCFEARAFIENLDGWRKIPLTQSAAELDEDD